MLHSTAIGTRELTRAPCDGIAFPPKTSHPAPSLRPRPSGTWQKRYFSIVTDDGSTLLKYWATEEASSEEGTEVGTADLSTICNIEIVDGVLNFEAFQPNKERNKDWALKGDAELIEE